MRKAFARELYKHMETNKDIFLVTADLGYGMWDKIRDDFPDRFLNTGASEQAAIDISIGLALEKKIPFVYSITTFLLYRPFEGLRTYINHEKIPVKLVGSGRNKDYLHDGISHWANDAKKILETLPNIDQILPESDIDIPDIVENMIYCNHPDFVSLRR